MLLGVGEDLKSVGLWHLQIEEEDGIGAGLEELKGGCAACGFIDLVPLGSEKDAERSSLFGGIIADQKARPGIDLGVVLLGDFGLHERNYAMAGRIGQ